jgi:hypothetical protein
MPPYKAEISKEDIDAIKDIFYKEDGLMDLDKDLQEESNILINIFSRLEERRCILRARADDLVQVVELQ